MIPEWHRARWRAGPTAFCLAGMLNIASAHAETTPIASAARPSPSAEQAYGELKATTMALIDALVEQGLLTRAKADELLRKAQAAAASGTATAKAGAEPGWGETRAVVRVPYVPETLKAQMKEDIKLDVLATARQENWADPRLLPSWLRSVTIEGDLRLRAESAQFDDGNLPAEYFRAQTDSPAWAPDLVNTQTDRNRFTLRARLGVLAQIGDDTTAGIRIATAGTSGPTGGSVTLGNWFNRYAVYFDRAWMRWEPRHGLGLEGGRMAVPFYGSDLLWPEDLSLDGLAGRGEFDLGTGVYGFATAGAFALEEFGYTSKDKWLYGAQAGIDWAISDLWGMRAAVALFEFSNVEGVRENELPPGGALAGVKAYQASQYPPSARLKGNTLISLNAPGSTAPPVWGLASKFRPVNLNLGLVARHFAPYDLGLMIDWVRNTGFDNNDIVRRAGTNAVADLANMTTGWQAQLLFGKRSLAEAGAWQAFLAYRHFERDAWIDALTNQNWHLGGTNYEGYSLGATYAFDRRATLGIRFTSTKNLDDGVRFLAIPGDPTSISGNLSSAPLKIDLLQVEANVRF